MSPAHGDLHRVQSVMARQVQQLRIKTEPLNALLFENDFAPFSAKCLEAALRIDEWQPQDNANDFVENNPRKFAERRLVHANQAAVHRARTDSYIVVFQGLDELSSFFNGC